MGRAALYSREPFDHYIAGPSNAQVQSSRIYFSALAQGLGQAKQSADLWKAATTHALERLYEYTAARPPSRTLLDPLAAFTIALQHGRSFKDAVNEAGTAADATKDLGAKAGRASYIKKEHLAGVSDPGAVGVYRILQGLLEGATENI